jgi:hypothetical protein
LIADIRRQVEQEDRASHWTDAISRLVRDITTQPE